MRKKMLADCQIIWPTTLKDWLDVLQSIAVIIASIVAFLGINSWRKEFVGKRKMELAEEILALFYQAKNTIEWMRFPAGYSNEGSSRTKEASETTEQKNIRDAAFVGVERYNKHSDIFGRIHALRYRFMAQFGKDAAAPFDKLKSILDELFVARRQWVMLSEVDEKIFTNPELLREHKSRIEKYDQILWGVGKGDSISIELEKAVQNIEEICQPYIDRK